MLSYILKIYIKTILKQLSHLNIFLPIFSPVEKKPGFSLKSVLKR